MAYVELVMLQLVTRIIANQYERPAFVGILTYAGIIYAVAGDWLIFGLTPLAVNMLACLVIVGLNINLVLPKLRS